jgi:hypothetical protein
MFDGGPGRSPTCDLRVRSALLYATELPGHLWLVPGCRNERPPLRVSFSVSRPPLKDRSARPTSAALRSISYFTAEATALARVVVGLPSSVLKSRDLLSNSPSEAQTSECASISAIGAGSPNPFKAPAYASSGRS